jgi:hypothetical protein
MTEENASMDFDFDIDPSDVRDLVAMSDPADGTHIYAVIYCGPDQAWGPKYPLGLSFVYQKLATVELVNPDATDSAIGSLIRENFTGNQIAMEIAKQRFVQMYGKEGYEKAVAEGKKFPHMAKEINGVSGKNSVFYLQIVTKVTTKADKKDKKIMRSNLRIMDIQRIGKDSLELPAGFTFAEYQPTLPESMKS